MKKLLIFDMDGTIADTSSGIYSSYCHVAKELGLPKPSHSDLSSVIGGPLPQNLQTVFGLKKDQVEEAITIYREYYSSIGFKQSFLYEDLESTVRELKRRGYVLSIATMKAMSFANRLIQMWGLEDVFSCVCGVDLNDSVTKVEMIKQCIEDAKISNKDTFMIGDSPYDYVASRSCGINFIAATYGFHYDESTCIRSNLQYINDVKSLLL